MFRCLMVAVSEAMMATDHAEVVREALNYISLASVNGPAFAALDSLEAELARLRGWSGELEGWLVQAREERDAYERQVQESNETWEALVRRYREALEQVCEVGDLAAVRVARAALTGETA